MNGTAYKHPTQTLNIPYTLIQPVIPGKQLTYKTPEQLVIWHYEDFILNIMKVMDLQCITHCADKDYQLITIHRADDTLIHVKPSKTLWKRLLKQKDKAKSIKTGVNLIQQASLLLNGTQYRTSNLIKDEIWKRNERWTMTDEDDRRDDMVNKEDMQERWKMKNNERHARRHGIFPEDDILDIITISRYNYHM